jgi:pyridoxamine 5'-phosphate oxidase
MIPISDLRRDYTLAGLREEEMPPDPMLQFQLWMEQAIAARLVEPNAMTLSTVDATGQPSGRIVLLKAFDERGFMFFTNYESAKGRELASNPRAALTFFWAELERQVRVQGSCEKLSRAEGEEYFCSRPLGSRLSAHVSLQSATIPGRSWLEERLEQVKRQYPSEQVPMPLYWGGYLLRPFSLEFWQGRPSRLHDRILYTRTADRWTLARLSP